MSGDNQRLLISVALNGCGDLDAMSALAAQIEAADIDMVVLGAASPGLDPFVTAGWLAPRISGAGLVVALPALHTEPFHAARALSALDILTKGRAGWAPATLGHAEQARRIGPAALTEPSQVAPKALDFIAATCALWDSWDADALIIDQESGVYLNSRRVRRVDYRGPFFQVMGPLNSARPLQGYPVLVQSDADPLWRLTADKTDVLLVEAAETDVLIARRAEIARAGGAAAALAVINLDDRPMAEMLARIDTWRAAGVIDGVHLTASSPAALSNVIGTLLPNLKGRGSMARSPGAESLRSRLRSKAEGEVVR